MMLRSLMISATALAWAVVLPAQEHWRPPSVEVRPFAGVFVPVGAQRSDFKSATMFGAQGAIEVNRHLHGLVSLGWTHGHNKLYVADVTQIWQYDIGAELNAVRDVGFGWYFRPFAGMGLGGRTYNYQASEVSTKSCTAGYGTLGGEMQRNVIALRAEVRDYLSCYESPLSGKKNTRNDLGITFGLAYHLR
jgi:hypothetical protein